VEKTKELYVFLQLVECLLTTISFDLWMPKGAHDIFALVVNFMDANW
jgi:hypothetical protein